MPARKLLIDADPSVDDAVAILMALASPEEIDLLAITTVAGNAPVALTTANALKTLELAGRPDVPVYAGAEQPFRGTLRDGRYVHGETGMDGYSLPAAAITQAGGFAADKIAETVLAAPPGQITLCCLAPLTNVALALRQAPEIGARLREIVVMGGAGREGGNITPCAEFNIFTDPEAAQAVFACGAPITLLPLDCTHQVLTSAARLARVRELSEPLYQLLSFNKRFHERRCGTDGAPLHDPTTIAWLLKPALFSGRQVNVEVELDGTLTRGMTVIDWWGVTGRPAQIRVLTAIDAEGFFDLVVELLARLFKAERPGAPPLDPAGA